MTDQLAMVSGGFDPLHVGHLQLLQHARRYGKVIVVLNSDNWLHKKKGYSFMSWADRYLIMCELKDVEKVVFVDDADGTICKALREYKPNFFCNGGDRKKGDPEEHKVCQILGIHEIFNLGRKIQSSSRLVREIRK